MTTYETPSRPIEDSSLIGCGVVDGRGSLVGTVASVVHEVGASDPAWLVVDSRWRRKPHYVPVEGSYPTPGGDLVIPYDRSWVMAAPTADSEHDPPSHQTRRRLETHYGDTYTWWPRRNGGRNGGSVLAIG